MFTEVIRIVSNSVRLHALPCFQVENIISNSIRMYNLTVIVFKIIRWAGPLPHAPTRIIKVEGFGGNGVKFRSASENKINPYLIILFKKMIITSKQPMSTRSICFERFVTIRQGRHGHSISGYWRF